MFADVEFLLHQISTNIATNYQANASPTYQNQKTNKKPEAGCFQEQNPFTVTE